jgi:hypothetical protein
VDFRSRLLATLRAVRPVLDVPGVLVLGSEVPNLLQEEAASTLVVSQDVDVGIPLSSHAAVKRRLAEIRELAPSPEEPSVWLPRESDLIEVNFIGMDPDATDPSGAFIFEDPELPLMVFGPLSLVRPGRELAVGDLKVPLPRIAGLAIEKLLTERSGEKGARDLLVVAGLLAVGSEEDLAELVATFRTLAPELRHAIRSNLTILSLMEPHPSMPDPRPLREAIAALLRDLELGDAAP